jgi:urease accessory protein
MAMPARLILPVLALLALSVEPALAHHPLGGMRPATFLHGLLSGIGHPILGFDHFAALVAAGCIAATQARGALLAVGYVIATLAGTAVHVMQVTVPGIEILVALSVIGLGAVLVSPRPFAFGIALAIFLIVGVIHGYALGESIAGAEPTPLYAYFIGLALVQSAIALAVMFSARLIMSRITSEPAIVRFVGAGIAGVGIATLVQHILTAAFGT